MVVPGGRVLAIPPAGASASFKVFPTILSLTRDRGEPSAGPFNVALRGERGRHFRVVVSAVLQQPKGSFAYVLPKDAPAALAR
jgi:hypothetical protein